MHRRDFLNTAGFGIVTACVGCTYKSMQVPNQSAQITIDVQKDLPQVGSWIIQKGVIIVRRSLPLFGSSFIAFQSECTHAANPLKWNETSQEFQCQLHGSIFSITGNVINGPANRALKSYPVQLNGQSLIITL